MSDMDVLLLEAAKRGDVSAVSRLLLDGAKVDTGDSHGTQI